MPVKNERERILLVDDSPDILELLQRNLASRGYRVFTAPGVAEAIQFLEGTPVDLVITDLKMPGATGLDLVRHVRENYRDMAVMMITGYATVESAVHAVQSGAEDYLPKPFTDDELFAAVGKVLDKLHTRLVQKTFIPSELRLPSGILGESESIRRVHAAIAKASQSSASVLITGESGTGKEMVARAIHYGGPVASAPFVPVNCGGIPEGLIESELFGYVKGAFTGAFESRAGFFQTAHGGTLFLDEISEMGPSMQVKMLRVLQDKEVFMLGARKSVPMSVRIIAASNKDLPGLIKNSAFREDLFFRLNVISIEVPPLRERGTDVILLARNFIERFARETGKPVATFSDRALDVLKNYHWPGNVRELENVIQRLMVMTEEPTIDAPDLPSLMRYSAVRRPGICRKLMEVEAEHIRNVLSSTDGNRAQAAEILGVDRKTLRNKMKKYGINPAR